MGLAPDCEPDLLSYETDSGRPLESLVLCQASLLILFSLCLREVGLSVTPDTSLGVVSDM